ncbi:MAG TPA: ATP-binding protein [Candidatus Limnocylindria bacterium]
MPFRVADTAEVLRHLVRLYPGPLGGLNEIVTNSADAYREARIEGGRVYVRVRRRRSFEIAVEDFSRGMTRQELAELPQKVAASHKREIDDPTVVGSKGIGLFGALAVGAAAEIASRLAGAKDTWLLRLRYDHLDEGAALDLATSGLAMPGTRVVVRDIPEMARKVLTPQRIVAYLREQKREALRSGLYRIFVIDEDAATQTEVLPAVFRGEPLGVHEISTPHGTVTFDLYVHPAPGDRRVEIIGRGGNRLLDDLATIEAFRNDVWASTQVEGTIAYAHLEATTGRAGIFQDRKHYPQFVHAVRRYEGDVRAALERLRDEAAQRLSGKVNDALRRAYQQVIEEIRPEAPLPVRTPVSDPRGEELLGAAVEERVPGALDHGDAEGGETGGNGAAPAIDRALSGRARGRWRSYPSWLLDRDASPDAPRSRFAEADGAIHLNAQHADYAAAKSAQLKGDARPMLVYQMGLLWKEFLLATDPYASAARQADELAGLVSRSQKYLPARL